MKKILTTLFVIITLNIFSQKVYQHFPKSNCIWFVEELNDFGEFESGSQIVIQKDTFVNGKHYTMLTRHLDSNLKVNKYTYRIYVREDTLTRKLYRWTPANGTVEDLYYDFSLNKGDTLHDSWLFYPAGSYVQQVDTILIQANKHRVLNIGDTPQSKWAPVIDGIGSLAGFLNKPYFFEGGSEVKCVRQGLNLLPYYKSDSTQTCGYFHFTGVESVKDKPELKTFPNPTLNSLQIISNQGPIGNLRLYNPSGQKIMERSYNSPDITLDLSNLNEGLYYIQIINTNGNFFYKKIIKK